MIGLPISLIGVTNQRGAEMNGGKRVGAGRKSPDGAQVVLKITVALDQESADMLEGFATPSVAVRALLKELREYRNGGPSRVLKSISPDTKRPPMPKKREVPTHNREGVKYNITKMIQLQGEEDRRHDEAVREWARFYG